MTEPLSKSQMRRIALSKQAEQEKQMTHEELLALLELRALLDGRMGAAQLEAEVVQALRAVVELIEDYKTSPAIANEEFYQGILALSNVILSAIEKELG